MHTRRVAAAAAVEGTAHEADHIAGIHDIAGGHRRVLEHVAVDRRDPIAAIDLHAVAEAATPSRLDHLSRACGANDRPRTVGKVEAIMETTERLQSPTEGRRDRPV